MAADGGREGQEMSRRIREELDRIRDAESRVEDALESVRQARRRVEVIARDLGREELRVRALVREELRAAGSPVAAETGAPLEERPADGEALRVWRTDPEVGWARRPAAPEVDAVPVAAALPEPIRVPVPVLAPPAGERRDVPLPSAQRSGSWTEDPRRLIGIGLVALLAVALVGWLAIRGLQRGSTPEPQPEPVAEQLAPAPPPPAPIEPTSAPDTTSVLAALPADPSARTALYDSLFTARSPLFDPLLAAVERDSEDRAIARALTAWREGSLDVQEGDLLHSAFVQAAIRLRMGRQLDVDGQLLRNPCRGGSCSALLDLWRAQRERYGLPEVPADAATNTSALRQVEVALVLDWMKETAGG